MNYNKPQTQLELFPWVSYFHMYVSILKGLEAEFIRFTDARFTKVPLKLPIRNVEGFVVLLTQQIWIS